MAARAAQEAEILTPAHALAFVARHGIVTEAARHATIPNLVDAIAGAPVRGNWWSHPRAKLIFVLTRAVRVAPSVLVCRLVAGKITFVHAAMWPALVRAAMGHRNGPLARLREVHSAGGKHVVEETPFPDWVPADVARSAAACDDDNSVGRVRRLLMTSLRRRGPASGGGAGNG